jgi:hypothetical protein
MLVLRRRVQKSESLIASGGEYTYRIDVDDPLDIKVDCHYQIHEPRIQHRTSPGWLDVRLGSRWDFIHRKDLYNE